MRHIDMMQADACAFQTGDRLLPAIGLLLESQTKGIVMGQQVAQTLFQQVQVRRRIHRQLPGHHEAIRIGQIPFIEETVLNRRKWNRTGHQSLFGQDDAIGFHGHGSEASDGRVFEEVLGGQAQAGFFMRATIWMERILSPPSSKKLS